MRNKTTQTKKLHKKNIFASYVYEIKKSDTNKHRDLSTFNKK